MLSTDGGRDVLRVGSDGSSVATNKRTRVFAERGQGKPARSIRRPLQGQLGRTVIFEVEASELAGDCYERAECASFLHPPGEMPTCAFNA
eukprot:scaffold207902_cov27-Tisochrysis_lutea.AAC.1